MKTKDSFQINPKMARKKLLITGGSGLLGHAIAIEAIRDFDVYATFNRHAPQIAGCILCKLDLTDAAGTMSLFSEIRPDVVIHTAALRSID